jgi:hypothetical protein
MKIKGFDLNKLLTISVLWSLAASASANLIVNGGFEDNDVATNSWSFFTSDLVNGWEGSNVEIWDSFGGVVAHGGTQHAELNAHPYSGDIFSIYQDFATVVGQSYLVDFFYRARVDNQEAFSFSVGSLSGILDDHEVGSWSHYSGSFVADSTLSTIRFSSLNTGTLGNFLDDVSVMASIDVVESNPLVLFVIGLVGLGIIRRKVKA